MARFCTQCGSQVGEEVRFCTRCGAPTPTPTGSAVTPAPPHSGGSAMPAAQGMANPPLQATPAPAAVSPSQGKPSPVVKIVLMVVGVIVLLGILGVASCVFMLHRAAERIRVNQARNGGSISINTPQGEVKIGGRDNTTAPIAGVPVYPGATPLEQGAQLSFGSAGGIAMQEYETSDPVDQVVSFYKEHWAGQVSVVENQGHYRMALEKKEGDTSSTTTIDVETESQNGKTKITIAHIGK